MDSLGSCIALGTEKMILLDQPLPKNSGGTAQYWKIFCSCLKLVNNTTKELAKGLGDRQVTNRQGGRQGQHPVTHILFPTAAGRLNVPALARGTIARLRENREIASCEQCQFSRSTLRSAFLPACQLEMTLPRGFPGRIEGDAACDGSTTRPRSSTAAMSHVQA